MIISDQRISDMAWDFVRDMPLYEDDQADMLNKAIRAAIVTCVLRKGAKWNL